jgi:hypothetical protein
LGCLVTARTDPAFQDQLAHAECEKLRWFVPTVRAFDVSDPEGRCVGRPEGDRDEWIAFPQFFAAGFANRGPFPERNLFYL